MKGKKGMIGFVRTDFAHDFPDLIQPFPLNFCGGEVMPAMNWSMVHSLFVLDISSSITA